MIPTTIVVHHSASLPNTPISEIDRWHKMRGFNKSSLGFYIGYHYVILTSGQIVQTRRDNEIGCHTIPNDGKIGICLIGNFMTESPTYEQINSLTDLSRKLKLAYAISYVFGHRDFQNTLCPGDILYKFALIDKISWLKKLLDVLLKKH